MNDLVKEKNNSDFARIWRYYFNPKSRIVLTEREERIRERWAFAWTLLAEQLNSRREVANAICQQWQVELHTALRDVKYAMMLFGDPREANKKAKRALAEEWIMKGIKKAWDEGDLDAYERLLNRYIKVNDLENMEDANKRLKDLKPHTILIVANPAELQKQAEELQQQITIDVPHQPA